MVGVNQLWAQTEEVLMDKVCRHLIERVACHVVLARNSVNIQVLPQAFILWQRPKYQRRFVVYACLL